MKTLHHASASVQVHPIKLEDARKKHILLLLFILLSLLTFAGQKALPLPLKHTPVKAQKQTQTVTNNKTGINTKTKYVLNSIAFRAMLSK